MQGFGTTEQDDRGRLCYRPPAVPPFPKMEAVWRHYERAITAVNAFDQALIEFPISGPVSGPVCGVVGSLFARLDAVHSSGAEGSTTTFTDLMEYQTSLQQAPDPEDARSVAAVAQAFDDLSGSGSAWSPARTVQDIHRRLFQSARDPMVAAGAGQWKSYPNGTFDPERPGAIFYYTRPASTPDAMTEWQEFSLGEGDRPELIRQALSHWMFEHIHPVSDGNGRVGRLMVPLLMKRKGALRTACAFLGEAVHQNKTVYVDALKDGRLTGDLGSWTRVFCSMIAQTAQANLERLAGLRRIHEHWLERTAASFRSHSVAHRLVPYAITRPLFTIRDAQAVTGGTFHALNLAVAKLVGLGLLTLHRASRRERLFAAPDVLALFEPVPRPAATFRP